MHKACSFLAVSVFSLSRIAHYAPSLQKEKHLKNNYALYHTLILFTYLNSLNGYFPLHDIHAAESEEEG